ncbi:MAG: CBS domain-containing protein [Candidatus Micrarchaeota archaeon]
MKTDVRVGDCMRRGVVTLRATDKAVDAAKQMKTHSIGSVVVTEEQKAVGIVTETDIAYKIVARGLDPKKTTLKKIMSAPLRTIGTDASINDVAEVMRTNRIKRIPVVDKNERLIGIITDDDLVGVFPGLIEVLNENYKMHEFVDNVVFAGICWKCGSYSETLRKSQGKLFCEECREEEEI